MNICDVIEHLETASEPVIARRMGWNGKNQFLYLVRGSTFKVNREPLNQLFAEGTEVEYHKHLDMWTEAGYAIPWMCSQADLFATDWFVEYVDPITNAPPEAPKDAA